MGKQLLVEASLKHSKPLSKALGRALKVARREKE
jgi:hypothetical protein